MIQYVASVKLATKVLKESKVKVLVVQSGPCQCVIIILLDHYYYHYY